MTLPLAAVSSTTEQAEPHGTHGAVDATIERIKATLFHELVHNFDRYLVADLEGAVDVFESFLRQYLHSSILAHANRFLAEATARPESSILESADHLTEVLLGESVSHQRTLEIAFVLQDWDAHRTRTVTKVMNHKGFGRYSRFEVTWPSEIGMFWERLAELIAAIVSTAYKWLENFVATKLLCIETGLAQDLYAFARSAFHCEKRLRRFWFIAVKDQKGYCLFDHRSALNVIEMASVISQKGDLTGSTIATHFLTNEADFDLMVARDAISEGKCIDVPFSNTRYRQVDFEFSKAEAALHQASSITLFPLVREGDGYLLAGFPTPSRSFFEPLLAAHQEDIVTMFRARFDTLKSLSATLQKRMNFGSAGKLGEFCGGFAKTFLEPS